MSTDTRLSWMSLSRRSTRRGVRSCVGSERIASSTRLLWAYSGHTWPYSHHGHRAEGLASKVCVPSMEDTKFETSWMQRSISALRSSNVILIPLFR